MPETNTTPVKRKRAAKLPEYPMTNSISGSQIDVSFGSLNESDYQEKFRGNRRIDTCRDMRNSNSMIDAVLNAEERMLCRMQWPVVCEDEQISEWVEKSIWESMEIGFQNFLRIATGEPLQYGYKAFEIIWAIGDDGYIQLKNLSPLKHKRVKKWIVNDEGALTGIQYSAFKYSADGNMKLEVPVFIPREKLLILTWRYDGSNPTGIPALLSIYTEHRVRQEVTKLAAIFASRFACPPPIISIKEDKMNEGNVSWADNAARDWQSHEYGRLIIPDYMTVNFPDMKGASNTGNIEFLRYLNDLIARNMLLQIMTLGEGVNGSYALSISMNDLLEKSIQSYADFLANELTRQVIIPAVRYRFGEQDKYPYVEATGLSKKDTAQQATELKTLAEAGILLVDKPLRDYARSERGLPDEDEAEIAEQQQRREEAAARIREQMAQEKPEDEDEEEKEEKETPKPEEEKCLHGKQIEVASAWQLRRNPKKEEAGIINFAEIMTKMNTYHRNALDILKDFQKKTLAPWLGELTMQVEGDIAGMVKKYPPGYANLRRQMKEVTKDAYYFGKEQFSKEADITKQKQIVSEEEAIKILEAEVELRMAAWLNSYKMTASELYVQVNNKIVHNMATATEALNDIINAIGDIAEARSAQLSSALTATGQGEGRRVAAEQAQIKMVRRSAIFDYNLCDVCAAKDGMILPIDDPDAVVPDPNCLGAAGGNTCRCLIYPSEGVPE